MGEKRVLPPSLRKALDWDAVASEKFVKFVDQNYGPLSRHRGYLKGLEYSCHGIPWFIGCATFIFLLTSPALQTLFVNLFIALLIDAAVVTVLKAITRRRRPSGNITEDMFATVSVDKFSFPSGHATRAVMLSILLPLQYDLWLLLDMALVSWGAAVCVSRVLLRRHHLLDVAGGVVVGVLQALVISYLWLSTESAMGVVGYFLDETQAGASYDV